MRLPKRLSHALGRMIASIVPVVVVLGSAAFALADDPTGTWTMENGKITVGVDSCDGNLCGTIVAMKRPVDKHGHPKRDKNNPNPALRTRPLIGLTVVTQMKSDGKGSWTGKIYNPDDGNTYNSSMTLAGGEMRVKGCLLNGVICKNVTLTRVPEGL